MATSLRVPRASLEQRVNVRVQSSTLRRWRICEVLQRELDANTYYVRGRSFRADRILSRALSLYRGRLTRELVRMGRDPAAILASATGTPPPTPKSMPNLRPPVPIDYGGPR